MSSADLPVQQTEPVYKQVEAETILEALKAGCAVNFEQAEISASVCLKDFTFSEPVRFSNCDFSGQLDLSGCRFNKGFSFIGCVFEQEVWLEGARADGDSQFRACRFYKECRFDRLHVNGKLEVRAPRNIEPLRGNRYYTKENENSRYTPYVIFKEHANFSQIHISGEANFGSVQFLKGADFYNARIDGPAFFRRDGCKEQDKKKRFPDEDFKNTRFEGNTVRNTARFRDAHFGSELDFKGAEFHCDGDFTYVHCQGIAFFCDELKPKEKPEHPSKFRQKLDFEGAQFETSLRLDTAEFNDAYEVNFKDCRIAETLGFTTVPKRLIMTGCSYKRVECDPEKLVEAFKQREESQKKFDRSSWIQLETTLRNGGEVKRADHVYRCRMSQERKYNSLAGYQKLLNRVWQLVAGYGTAPWRLAVICCLMLLVGTVTLRLGQLKPVTKDVLACPMTTGTAFEVSLSQFTPFKLPVGEDCAPEGWSRWIALLLRIGGGILVPLLAANLAGLLHRKAGPTLESKGGDE